MALVTHRLLSSYIIRPRDKIESKARSRVGGSWTRAESAGREDNFDLAHDHGTEYFGRKMEIKLSVHTHIPKVLSTFRVGSDARSTCWSILILSTEDDFLKRRASIG